MSFAKGAAFFVVLHALFFLMRQSSGAAGDVLSPIFPPLLNGLCNAVDCGKGICRVSEKHSFGFVCDCNPGWTQFHIADHFRFLPCVVPNCSINYSCSNNSAAPSSPPFPPPPENLTLFDPCTWSNCGGGECLQTSAFDHRCECKQGYNNLLSVSSFPCYRECSIDDDCENLGISLSNSTSSSPSSSPQPNISNLVVWKSMLWFLMTMMMLSMIRMI
ncbi:hypothetical protein AXF42_Ash013015 [Apostasia shenzhenica]|uniref:EGF-like domain-containing protein n=1 Tax=Apostasia shenzhenica TaxID=1088818 RepID=A0A2I0ARW0_9ASPA|nr:hypothetical protein AXF42_Ash013015 [Apostasia shenzhenica]